MNKTSESSFNDFFVRMYENSCTLYAIVEIELDENGNPADGTCVYCNPAFARMIGNVTKEQVIGRKNSEILPVSSRKWLSICYEAAFLGNTIEIKDTLEEKDAFLRLRENR